MTLNSLPERHTATSTALGDQQIERPSCAPVSLNDRIPVSCGELYGVFQVSTGRICVENGTLAGEEVTPSEFEKLSGRKGGRKVKEGIRLTDENGLPGRCFMQWLKANGLDKREYLMSSVRSALKRHTNEKDQPKDAQAEERVDNNLNKVILGLLPSDPTVDSLPAELPHTTKASSKPVVDLAHMTYEELQELVFAANGDLDPFAVLLKNPPGVQLEHRAYITGQAPPRKKRAMKPMSGFVSQVDTLLRLGDYLDGRRPEAPWPALGVTRAPIVCSRDLNLRQLYNTVMQFGGYNSTTSQRMWASIAERMGWKASQPNAGWLLKNCYIRFLLKYEQQVQPYKALQGSEQKPVICQTKDIPT